MAVPSGFTNSDTIAAIATGMSESGIGIVRISGPDACKVIDSLYRTGKGARLHSWEPGTIRHGFIVDPDSNETLDEVMVSWMKAPHSYTAEDTAEINTHGGLLVMERVLDAVIRAGARSAQPGEFTKRAFLNGRVDLSEAEAVMDLIHAQSEFAVRSSLHQLSGGISREIRLLRERILHEIAFIEAALDDPEHYSLDGYPAQLMETCSDLVSRMRAILDYSDKGQLLHDGIRTVIVGRPNAGKSSLLNLLSGTDRAIVTDVPGTTRDTLEEVVRLGSLSLLLTDTAGICDSDDTVERIGIDRARKVLDMAQLILFVIDRSVPLSQEDVRIAGLIQKRMEEGVECIVLLNKSDLSSCVCEDEVLRLFVPQPLLMTFCTADRGDALRLEKTIEELFHAGAICSSSEVFLSSEREKEEMRRALCSLMMVQDSIRSGLSGEFYSIDLQDAYAALGRVIGETVEDDVVNRIFSEFCMGK